MVGTAGLDRVARQERSKVGDARGEAFTDDVAGDVLEARNGADHGHPGGTGRHTVRISSPR